MFLTIKLYHKNGEKSVVFNPKSLVNTPLLAILQSAKVIETKGVIMAKNQLRLGAILSYINMAIGSLIPMFYTPVMLQLLGQDEYGLYKLASSVTSYLSLISFGIGSAVVRYFTKYIAEGDKEGEENIFGLFNIIFSIIAAIAVVAGVIISLNLNLIYSNSLNQSQLLKMQILVIVLTFNIALSFLCSPQNAAVTSHEKFFFLQIINILTTVIIPVANLVALFFGFKSIGLVVSSLLINIIVRIAYAIYVRCVLQLKARYNNLPKNLLKEILLFSFWIFVANIVNQLYATTDTLIIGAIPALATVGVAVYNIGVTFSSMMSNFSVGLLNVLTPKVNKMVFSNSSNTELTDLMIRIGRLQCYIVSLVCTGFIAFGRQFIQLWAGTGYEDAYWIALFTMIPSCVPLVQNVAMNIIVAQNKHRFRSLTYLGIAIANVIGTVLCVDQFGIIGAALVTGLASIVGQGFVMNWYYWRKIHLEIPRFWKSVVGIFLGPVIMCALTLIIFEFIDFYNIIALFSGIIIYTIIFFTYSWFFVMNDYEKVIFRKPITLIVNKFKKKSGDTN